MSAPSTDSPVTCRQTPRCNTAAAGLGESGAVASVPAEGKGAVVRTALWASPMVSVIPGCAASSPQTQQLEIINNMGYSARFQWVRHRVA